MGVVRDWAVGGWFEDEQEVEAEDDDGGWLLVEDHSSGPTWRGQ